ncbi:retrovirus-related pol polyprotein from transposon TNT 1-94 [Tanacetum coccineum]
MSMDTQCASETLDPLSQKLEDESVSLEFQVLNYAKENAHFKTTYKNLFDSINLRAQLFDKVFEQKDTTKGTSVNTKFANQSTSGTKLYSVTPLPKTRVPPKVVESKDLINPFKTFREENFMPINKAKASVRTNPITVSQPHVITKNNDKSDSNGLSSTRVENTAKTRRPQPKSNTKNDRVPSASKSSCIKNKKVEVEEHHRNLLLSKNHKHKSHNVITLSLLFEMINLKFKSECQPDSSTGDNARTSNPKEPTSKRFLNSTFSLAGCPNLFMVRRLRSKDEAPEEIKTFLKKIQVLLQALVIIVRTDNDIEFKNQVLKEYSDDVGISHQTSSIKTPQQNRFVQRRNQTLVEAARTMFICFNNLGKNLNHF